MDDGEYNAEFKTYVIGHSVITNTISLLVQAKKEYYKKTKEENLKIRMPIDHNTILNTIKEYFNDKCITLKNILAGHEYDNEKGKCHYQCMIWFDKKYRIYIEHVTLYKNTNEECYFSYQKANHPYALKNYCMKGGDYKYLNENVAYKKKVNINEINKKTLTEEPKNYINSDNTYKEIEEIIDTNKTLILSTKNTSDEKIKQILNIAKELFEKYDGIFERIDKNFALKKDENRELKNELILKDNEINELKRQLFRSRENSWGKIEGTMG